MRVGRHAEAVSGTKLREQADARHFPASATVLRAECREAQHKEGSTRGCATLPRRPASRPAPLEGRHLLPGLAAGYATLLMIPEQTRKIA